MKKTLQVLSMMNDVHIKKSMRLICYAGCLFAVGTYCASDESNRISGLALISYFILLIQLIQMNKGVMGKNSSGLELLYQSDRKKEILRYGILLYNLLTLLVYLVFSWLCILGFSLFKDVGMAYIPLSLVIVMTSIYTTLLLLFQVHGYEKICNVCSILYMIFFVSAIFLSFDIFPIRLQIPSFFMSISSLPYVLMMMLAALLVLVGMDYYLYGKNKGLRANKKR